MNMVQSRLSTLVGRPSGYVEQLPKDVKKRVTGLKGIQQEHAKIENEFQLEILELEKKVRDFFQEKILFLFPFSCSLLFYFSEERRGVPFNQEGLNC